MKNGKYNLIEVDSNGKIFSGGLVNYATELDTAMVNYFSLTGTTIAISGVSDGESNYSKLSFATSLTNDNRFESSSTAEITYKGDKTSAFFVNATISLSPATSNDTFVFGFFLNGALVNQSRVIHHTHLNGEVTTTCLSVLMNLAYDDVIEVYVANTVGSDDIVIYSLTLTAHG